MLEEEIEAQKKLIEQFSNVFVWSYEEFKGILRDMVKTEFLLFQERGQ